MKKLFLIFLLFLIVNVSSADTIKGSVSEVKVPEGFYGSWRVVSKMTESNNPSMFNPVSVDIWGLQGVGNILILTNEFTGSTSQIKVNKENIQGLKLKFTRIKEENDGEYLTKQTESPEITLRGDIFEGFDLFIIEKYKNGTILEKNIVKYKIIGQKISGESGK